jgi:endonuclease/exonuclease/phosphatase family metal-dependent hydrolase
MSLLRILTYNVQFCRGVDRAVDISRIAGAIAPFEPDVLALQEVDIQCARSGTCDQAQRLGEALGMEVMFGAALPLGTGRSGNATLTRLPVLATRQIRLPVAVASHEPRCALVTRFGWRGLEVDVINTHLSDRSAGDRLAQAEELLRAIGEDPTVVCGDLNCTPWSRPFRRLARHLRPVASPRSWPSPLPIIPLDHILIRGDLSVVRSGLWRGPGVRRASDHLPVFAELVPAFHAAAA